MQNKNVTKELRKRLIVVFIIFMIVFVLLIFRLAWHQIVKGDEYSQRAYKQQTADNIISASRGDILDRNGNQLAISATANTIWARPSTIKSNGKTDAEIEKNAREEAKVLADFFSLDEEETYQNIISNKSLVKIQKNVSGERAEELRALDLCGIEISEESKRYYPLNSLASQIIGITTDDNVGLIGLEKHYNQFLSGVNGRRITSKDNHQNELIVGTDKYYSAQNGYTILTTIDETIQKIVEDKVSSYCEEFDADRVFSIVMDPKTGEILAMAQSDQFNLNEPRSAKVGDEKNYAKLSESEKVDYWSRMWRNFCISDVYEPGSTFKPITAALALDYGVVNLNEKIYCAGKIDVEDWTIKCWAYPKAHGYETISEAVMSSCNPVMVQLIQRIGKERFYDGLRTFCITEPTGIDYPGEGSNIIYNQKSAGPVELATMAFGQGIAVTPISLISAFASLANDGKLMQPHFVKQVIDSEGNIVEDVQPTVRNVTVSAETASDMMTILEEVVSEGGGGKAAISGYRIGGKTGTSYKPVDGKYSTTEVFTSFIGIAPMEDPKYIILVGFDTPKKNRTASNTACVCEKEIMQEILLYANIPPQYSTEELAKINKKKVEVPDLSGKTLDDAIGILGGKGLEYSISPKLNAGYQDTLVKDQYPKKGTEVNKGSIVTLYYE